MPTMNENGKDGYIYVLSNAAMPGLLKIGQTRRDPFQRARELQTTGVPFPFRVEAAVRVGDPAEVERRLHKRFSDVRQTVGREFFRTHVNDVLTELLQYTSPQGEAGKAEATPEISSTPPWAVQARTLLDLYGLTLMEVGAHLNVSTREIQKAVASSSPLQVSHPQFGTGTFLQGHHSGKARVVHLYFPGVGHKQMRLEDSQLTVLENRAPT